MAYYQQPQQYGEQPPAYSQQYPAQQAPQGYDEKSPPQQGQQGYDAKYPIPQPQAFPPQAPQPSMAPQQDPLEFHVYAENGRLRRKGVTIMFPDKRTPAYYVDIDRKDMVVRRGGPYGPVVGEVVFHSFSRHMELIFGNNQRVEIGKDGVFSTTYSVTLPAAGPQARFAWRRKWGGGLRLEDAAGTAMAEFSRSPGISKDGRLSMLVSGLDQQLMDQIIVAFMAVEEKLRRARAAAGASAGAAGGGGGC